MAFKEKWEKVWNFEKKMRVIILVAILMLTIVTIGISTISFAYNMTKRNRQYVSAQLETMAEDYADNLNQYKALAVSLALDRNVQDFCSAETVNAAYQVMGDTYSTLLSMLYTQSNANFIAVTNDKAGTYVYNGNISMQKTRYEKRLKEDYEASILACESGSIRMSFSNLFSREKDSYSLTVYFPAYSVTHIGKSNGIIVINLTDSILGRLQEKNGLADSCMYLVSSEGTIVSAGDNESIGETISYAQQLNGKSGEFWHDGSKVSYRRVGKWNYYLIYELSSSELYGNITQMAILMLIVILAVAVIVLTASRKSIQRLYDPLNKIVNKMNDVSKGNLGTRIHTEDTDSDSRKLADGFNRMMDEIDILMEQVKREEQQMTQMQLNALQSQIQPHFLYNTLECIHWQAAADGNREISTMVKALAQYYRICLSSGKDIITLGTELDHIRNYLIIQNMRYDNIINLKINIDEAYYNVEIPKLTLQPLVENSIYHGIRVEEGRKGIVEISARDEDEDIVILLADNGQGMGKEEIERINHTIREFDRTMGYGINNVNKRLELLFGSAYGLRFSPSEAGGLLVEIRLPKQREEKTDV